MESHWLFGSSKSSDLCEEVRVKVEEFLREVGLKEDTAKVFTKKVGDMCACDINFKTSMIRLSIINGIRERLQAEGYRVDADIASQCYKPDYPLGLRMNVWRKR